MDPRVLEPPYREPWRPPPPPRPPFGWPLLVAAGCVGLLAFTSHKLATMARLRGERPGSPQRYMVLEGEIRRFNPRSAVYALGDPDSHDTGSWEIQLTSAQMERMRFGQSLAVRCLDERECFVHDSVYIDDGNVGFDRALLAVELAGLCACVWTVARRQLAWRRSLRRG